MLNAVPTTGLPTFRDLILRIVEMERGNKSAAARRIGVSPSTVIRWLDPTEPNRPEVAECRKIAAVFGMPAIFVVAIAHDLELPSHSDVVGIDPHLHPDAKNHITRQYDLLRRIAPTEPDPPPGPPR